MRLRDEKEMFGRASAPVAAELTALTYPISKQEIIASVGKVEVSYDRDTKTSLAELFRGVPATRFKDASQAARAVDERWTRFAQALREVERGAQDIEARSRSR